jgi:hypothetical protein
MLGTINEKTTATITVTFTDEDGAATTPTGGSYRIDTPAGAVIKSATAFTPTTNAYVIATTVVNNTLIDSTLSTEGRIITVTWTYSGSKQGSTELRYNVKNLRFV